MLNFAGFSLKEHKKAPQGRFFVTQSHSTDSHRKQKKEKTWPRLKTLKILTRKGTSSSKVQGSTTSGILM
jgi:hypothetical protein